MTFFLGLKLLAGSGVTWLGRDSDGQASQEMKIWQRQSRGCRDGTEGDSQERTMGRKWWLLDTGGDRRDKSSPHLESPAWEAD